MSVSYGHSLADAIMPENIVEDFGGDDAGLAGDLGEVVDDLTQVLGKEV